MHPNGNPVVVATNATIDSLVNNAIASNPNADLNHIDVSGVTNMRQLFSKEMAAYRGVDPKRFRGDISKWDVSNVTDMSEMFGQSHFNGDVSAWDVRRVENFTGIFQKSKFRGDLSRWQVSPKAKCQMAVASARLSAMPKPSFFHWDRALQSSLDMPWEWSAHFLTHVKTAKMLGMSPPEAAVFIQEQWLWGQQPKSEPVELPALGL